MKAKTFDKIVSRYQRQNPFERMKSLADNAIAHCRVWNGSSQQFLLVMALIENCAETGFCDQTTARLARQCLITNEAAEKALASLVKRGIIVLDRRPDGAIWRTIRFPVVEDTT